MWHCDCVCVWLRSDSEMEPPAPKKARKDPFADLRDGASSSSQATGAVLSGREELARYKSLEVPAAYASPLIFWREHRREFPLLSEVARRVLCISASSAQSERDFSCVGHTITDTRSRLSSEKVESIELIRWGLRAGLVWWLYCYWWWGAVTMIVMMMLSMQGWKIALKKV